MTALDEPALYGHRDLDRTVEELVHVTTELARERDLPRMLARIVTAARALSRAEAGRIYTLDPLKRHLIPSVWQNERAETPLALCRPVPLYRDDETNTSHVAAWCAVAGKPAVLPDVYAYTGFEFDWLYEIDRVVGYRTTSLVAVPLRDADGLTIGVLELTNLADMSTQPGSRPSFELAWLIKVFASQAAIALGNVRLIAENQRLIQVLDSTNRKLVEENRQLKRQIGGRGRFPGIVGESPKMGQVFSLMEKVLDSDVTVLVLGETGTGKEEVARAIHARGARSAKPFIAQNCAALPEQLLESELFGYRRGAFTGAMTDKPGLFEAAHGGTLFLDEIGDMPLGLQAKILRVLQEGEVRRLGALESRKVDVRVIAATHQDLRGRIASGDFREDLYYRLSIFPIALPPLRERIEDVPLLVEHFLKRQAGDRATPSFSPAAFEALQRYAYPGNVRELRNVIERAVLLCEPGEPIRLDHLPPELVADGRPAAAPETSALDDDPALALKDVVARYEADVIRRRLARLEWNQTRTATALGLSRRALVEKIGRYGIRRPDDR